MLEFICPTCGSFNLDEPGCESCTGRTNSADPNVQA
jgi:hypothetical protein